MSRAQRPAALPAAVLSTFLLLAGCATSREAARPAPGGLDVRLPVAESFEFTRRTAAPPGPAPAPFFEDDEYRHTGRWLTLFEVDFSSQGRPAPTAPAETPPEGP